MSCAAAAAAPACSDSQVGTCMPLPGCPSPVEANGECYCSSDASLVEPETGTEGGTGEDAAQGVDAIASPEDSGAAAVDAQPAPDSGSTPPTDGGAGG
jgi:hypothetical protein